MLGRPQIKLFFSLQTLSYAKYPNDRKEFFWLSLKRDMRMLQVLKELPSIQRADVVLHVVPANFCRSHDSQVGKKGGNILATLPCSLFRSGHVSSILRQGEPKDVLPGNDEISNDLLDHHGFKEGLKRLQSILSNSVSQ